ncbi:hypothetical protein F2Q70_00010439 [Brassica cretica]|uniref:SMP domain-containing protein n=1 Tax=Brassica cretica TaxID=69181 RepID=A0A8S9M0A5_BRACR|nr:hypothetical protein F2Q70_00010439 [Brassica cretica]
MPDSRMFWLWLFTHTSGLVDADGVNPPVLLPTQLEKVNNGAGLPIGQLDPTETAAPAANVRVVPIAVVVKIAPPARAARKVDYLSVAGAHSSNEN